MKTKNYDNLSDIEINVSDLEKGIYMMTIISKEGNSTQKFSLKTNKLYLSN